MINFCKSNFFKTFICLLVLLLIFQLGYQFGKNKVISLNNTENLTQGNINVGFSDTLNNGDIPIDISIPESLIYQVLSDLIIESEVKGIDNLYLNISSKGLDLSAKYTLLGFIKIPAQFTLMPEIDNGDIKLSINNVKIANLKIKIDKIIEKWIGLNEDMKEFVTYDSGSIFIDGSIIKVADIKEISLINGFINLKLNINKDNI